jgi:hypothetical protein
MATTFGQYGHHRVFESIPGLIVWATFILAIITSFLAPTIAIIFIIIFDLYWLLRVFYFIIHLLASYGEYRRTLAINWYAELATLPNWERIYHVVMLPTYKEDLSILREALHAVQNTPYRQDRFIVVLGGEEGDAVNFAEYQKILATEFAGAFADLIFTTHPANLLGEIPGKGSNLHFMAGVVKQHIDAKNIPYDDIIVSAFDIDTIVHEQYFSRLAYLFLTVPNPTRSSYQPVTLFSNNIWTATAPVRISAFGTTFWLLSELVRPERLWTFSSHSMPWRMLVDVGFWEPDVVSEDSRIFLQGLLHYEGDYRVTPLFLPVSMDTVTGKTYLQSLVALYKQQRRWAWGVEHFAYMMTQFPKHPKISRAIKFKYLFNQMEGMYTWATAPILIFILGYLPFWVVGNSQNAFIANSPFTLQWIMRIATVGVFVTGAMSLVILPRRKSKATPLNWLVMIAQWVLLPVTSILFSAFPAIDAQTRFIFGKYLGFNVTTKHR